MPLPFFLAVAAGVAGVAGVGSGIHGAAKAKEAKETMESADRIHRRNIAKFKETCTKTTEVMDILGKRELEILSSFEDFSEVFEKISCRPEFRKIDKNCLDIPKYDAERLKEVSVGAGVLLGGMGGAALGTAGGFAAAGAATSAVMALGTASTGTAIASLSGAAATNAALAAIGGGSLAVGGGGIALGTTLLGASTLGVGLLVGGIIFSITGSSLSSKADEAWHQMKSAEKDIKKSVAFMNKLTLTAKKYIKALDTVNRRYEEYLSRLKLIVNTNNRTDWNAYTEEEKRVTENTAMLVQMLYGMCKVELVLVSEDVSKPNKVNSAKAHEYIDNVDSLLEDMENQLTFA